MKAQLSSKLVVINILVCVFWLPTRAKRFPSSLTGCLCFLADFFFYLHQSVEMIVKFDLNTDGGLLRRGRSELFKCLAKIYRKASEKFNVMWATLSQQFLGSFFRSLLFE